MIEKYDFGELRVDGEEYRRDVIIYPEDAYSSQRVHLMVKLTTRQSQLPSVSA